MSPEPYNFSWSEAERKAGELSGRHERSASCFKGVWYQPGHAVDVPAEINRHRGKSCHWIEYSPSMSYPAAEELLEHRRHQRDVTRQWVRIGIAVAVLVLGILAFVYQVLKTSAASSP